jgi:hypothetical protein
MTQREARRALVRERAVVRVFYEEMTRLGVLPDGAYRWRKKDAIRMARAIARGVGQVKTR